MHASKQTDFMILNRLFIDNSEMSADEMREIYGTAHVVLIPYAGGQADAHALWVQTIYEVYAGDMMSACALCVIKRDSL